jgi:hypothetical protein
MFIKFATLAPVHRMNVQGRGGQGCVAGVSQGRGGQGSAAEVPQGWSGQGCVARISQGWSGQGCVARISQGWSGQGCVARISQGRGGQGCVARVSQGWEQDALRRERRYYAIFVSAGTRKSFNFVLSSKAFVAPPYATNAFLMGLKLEVSPLNNL